MGQKINPFIFRSVLNRNWDSYWFSNKKNFPKNLIDDINIRNIIDLNFKDKFYSKIIIQKSFTLINIFIYVEDKTSLIDNLNLVNIESNISKLVDKKVNLNLINIKNINTDINFIFYKLKEKIKQRKSYKVVLKNIFNEFFFAGGYGLKILIKGRLNGSTLSRIQIHKQGKLPLHRFSANIKYCFNHINTSYGIIGVKIWSYMGNFLYF